MRDTRLTIAYTPDSDDAFYYYGLQTGRVRLAGFRPTFVCEPIVTLNRAAVAAVHHVTAISSIVYPQIADRYAILAVGTSVGRGYGPVLVSRRHRALHELRGRRVGVGGIPTTGWFLLRWICPEAVPVELPFDRIAEAVAAGELDAGVMIHEELLFYPQLGLHRVVDLGAHWCRDTGLPLPVGLNVVRRDLGDKGMERVASAIQQSLEFGHAHRLDALDWVSRFGRGRAGACTEQFVDMFANQDSLAMPADVRAGLCVLCEQLVESGHFRRVPPLDIVEGSLAIPAERQS